MSSSRFPILKLALSSTLFLTCPAWGANYPVTTTADSGAGSLRAAMQSTNATPGTADTITIILPLNSTITLASNLPPLMKNVGTTLAINAAAAQGLTIDGNNNQVFFFDSGTFAVTGDATGPLAITGGKVTGATGGAVSEGGGGGGGGGAAAGGAIFLNSGVIAAFTNLALSNNTAQGGAGGTGGPGTAVPAAGGGGGAGAFGGGAGGTGMGYGGGGGGGGLPGGGIGGDSNFPPGNGGNAVAVGGATIGGGGGGGGTQVVNAGGGFGGTGAGSGNNGGNGAKVQGGSIPAQNGMGLGGGGGAGTSAPDMAVGGAGGPAGGGGGGGGVNGPTLNGGFGGLGGGGGGGGTNKPGFVGGLGGVGGGGGGGGGALGGSPVGLGGASLLAGGSGGSGGASSPSSLIVGGGGGGGAALGGAVYIGPGAQATFSGSFSVSGSTVTGGAGGAAGGTTADAGTAGRGLGVDFFMIDGSPSLLAFDLSNNLVLANPIATDQGLASMGTTAELTLSGASNLTLNGANTLTTLNVNGTGTLFLGSGASVPTLTNANINGTGALFLDSGATVPDTTTLSMASGTFNFTDAGSNVTLANIVSTGASPVIAMGPNSLTETTTAASDSFQGTITGTGSVTVTGNNTWLLTGTTSTYSGGTIINGNATLGIQGDGSLGQAGAPVTWTGTGINVPTLQIDAGPIVTSRPFNFNSPLSEINLQTFTVTTTGSSSGPGLLDIDGTSGVLQVEGAFAHTGGTIISGGTLAIAGPGSITGDIEIDGSAAFDISAATNPQTIGALIGNSGAAELRLGGNSLTLIPMNNTSFAGVISNTVSTARLILDAPYTLTLTGVSTMTGTVEVEKGTLNIASGAVVPAQFQIDAAGTLTGTGTVGGGTNGVNNFGTVAPGGISSGMTSGALNISGTNIVHNYRAVTQSTTIGTLNIAGPYVESGTLQIEVNDLGQASTINVTGIDGNITINPGTTLTPFPLLGSYTAPLTYTVATFTGTRTGTYTNVVVPLFNRYKAVAIYNAHNIQIEFITIPFTSLVTGDPASQCIESISGGVGSDGLYVINSLELISNSLPALSKAFNQMQPSQFGALALAQENNDILVRSTLTQRFGFRRMVNAPVERRESPVYSTEMSEGGEVQSAEPTKPEPVSAAAVNKGTAWFEPIGKYANQHSQQKNYGYQALTGGALGGADYQVCRNVYVGGATGYTFTDVKWDDIRDKATINSYYGAVYGAWYNKWAFADAALIGSYNHYHATRVIKFPGVNRKAQNSHGGYQLGGSLGTGLLFYPAEYQVEPFARADYVFVHQGSIREHGAQSIDLNIKDTDSRYVRSDLGCKVLYSYNYKNVKIIPYFKASWVWEKQLDSAEFRSSFKNTSCSFTSRGLRPARSLVAPSVGITVMSYDDSFSFSFHDDAEISRRFWENRAYLNFSYNY